MAFNIQNAFDILKYTYGSHSAAAIKIGLTPCHYRAIRNGRVHIPKRTADFIVLKAREVSEPSTIPAAKCRAEVLTAVARVNASLGDCQRLLAESETSGISPDMAREIRSILKEASLEYEKAGAMFASHASRKNEPCVSPLASVKTYKAVWWRLWRWKKENKKWECNER